MCGLVGYIGLKNARDILIDSLSLLEYRGYDSSGICLFIDDKIKVYKDACRVNELNKIIPSCNASLGIGHTRWATHGGVNKLNSHPHVSYDKRFILVHNGVIENYLLLKDKYLKDITFTSSTDSEVIVNLFAYFVSVSNISDALKRLIKELKGTYALLIMDATNPNTLYALKNKSPLLIGKGKGEVMASSDYLTFPSSIEYYVNLNDLEYVVINKNSFEVFDELGNEVILPCLINEVDKESVSKGDYPHFMLKEIEEIPSVIDRLINQYIFNDQIIISKDIIKRLEEAEIIYLVSCGTSYHASLFFKYYVEKKYLKKVECLIASEYIDSFTSLSRKSLIIVISQSGETQDVISFVNKVKEDNIFTLCLTNVPHSSLERLSEKTLYLEAKREIAVASTKAYVSEVILLYLLALSFNKYKNIKEELYQLKNSIEDIILRNKELDDIVSYIYNKNDLFYIGRGYGYLASLEASLKLKEVSYIHSEGIYSSELKHGPIALICDGFPVIALVDNLINKRFIDSSIEETKSRGAKVFNISFSENSDFRIKEVNEDLRIIPLVVVSQYIAYKVAGKRNLDVDKPRNLAKSVTVL